MYYGRDELDATPSDLGSDLESMMLCSSTTFTASTAALAAAYARYTATPSPRRPIASKQAHHITCIRDKEEEKKLPQSCRKDVTAYTTTTTTATTISPKMRYNTPTSDAVLDSSAIDEKPSVNARKRNNDWRRELADRVNGDLHSMGVQPASKSVPSTKNLWRDELKNRFKSDEFTAPDNEEETKGIDKARQWCINHGPREHMLYRQGAIKKTNTKTTTKNVPKNVPKTAPKPPLQDKQKTWSKQRNSIPTLLNTNNTIEMYPSKPDLINSMNLNKYDDSLSSKMPLDTHDTTRIPQHKQQPEHNLLTVPDKYTHNISNRITKSRKYSENAANIKVIQDKPVKLETSSLNKLHDKPGKLENSNQFQIANKKIPDKPLKLYTSNIKKRGEVNKVSTDESPKNVIIQNNKYLGSSNFRTIDRRSALPSPRRPILQPLRLANTYQVIDTSLPPPPTPEELLSVTSSEGHHAMTAKRCDRSAKQTSAYNDNNNIIATTTTTTTTTTSTTMNNTNTMEAGAALVNNTLASRHTANDRSSSSLLRNPCDRSGQQQSAHALSVRHRTRHVINGRITLYGYDVRKENTHWMRTLQKPMMMMTSSVRTRPRPLNAYNVCVALIIALSRSLRRL